MRRVFGIVAMLLMAHLTLVGDDLVCAKHSGGAAGDSASHVSHTMAEQQIVAQSPSTTGQQDNCHTPVKTNCCSAMSSCAVVMAIGPMRSLLSAASVKRETLPGSTAWAPLPVGAPETPPPRA
jgi:hypothetical protein